MFWGKWQDFTGEILCLICTLTFLKSCMLIWDKVLSLFYALLSEKKEKKRQAKLLLHYVLLHIYLFFLKGLIIIIIHMSMLSVFLF